MPVSKNAPNSSSSRRGRGLNDKQKTQIKKIIKGKMEKKFYVTLLNSTVDNAGSVIHLSPMVQGDDHNERIGDAVFPYKLKMRVSSISADTTNIIRAIIFKWNDDLAPVIADVLDVANVATPNQDYRQSWYAEKKGVIISDRVYNLSSTGTSYQVLENFSLKLKGRTQYTGPAGADYGQGQYWYLLLSDSTAATHPSIKYESKLLYTDA